jgi:hypothetical protein
MTRIKLALLAAGAVVALAVLMALGVGEERA